MAHATSSTISDEAAIFGLLSQPRSFESLDQYARESLGGRVDLPGLLDRWRELGIIFHDGGQMIHVAVEAHNQELTRVSAPGIASRAIAARKLREQFSDVALGAGR